jgi:hypothetical protein
VKRSSESIDATIDSERKLSCSSRAKDTSEPGLLKRDSIAFLSQIVRMNREEAYSALIRSLEKPQR